MYIKGGFNLSVKTNRSAYSSHNVTLFTALSLIIIALLALQTGLALAHSRLKSGNILPDSVITAAPASLTLTFTEETSEKETKVSVLDATGKAVDKGDLAVKGDTITLGLNALADGKYTVKFRTFTEDDSGLFEGEFSFTVAKAGTAANGSAAAVKEEELSTAPNTGFGGSAKSGFDPALPITFLVVGIVISGGVLLARHRIVK